MVYIIVLNWNQTSLTLSCLASLNQVPTRQGEVRIIVVDNASSADEDIRVIEAHYPALTLLRNVRNLGYAGGNNAGIRYALDHNADHICILNNDVTVAPDFLDHLLAATEQSPNAGIGTPLISEAANPSLIWALGSAVERKTGAVTRLHAGERVASWAGQDAFPVEVASGAAMLVERQVVEKIGLLDEAFFLYYEETDWCLRARAAGYQILAVPKSCVSHKVSATLGGTSPQVDYYMLRNHLRLIARHWHGLRRAHVLTSTVLRDLLIIAAYTAKSHGGARNASRNARLLALRDAALRRWGPMGADVERACRAQH